MKYSSIIILSSVLTLSSMSANAQINKVNDVQMSEVSGQFKIPNVKVEAQNFIRESAENYIKNKIKNKIRDTLPILSS